MKSMRVDVLVISNYEPGDESFDSDVGSWNVTRAKHDCAAGKHKPYTFDVAEVLSNNANIEVDQDKVAAMVAAPATLRKSPPPIFIAEHGKIWLIDGHHRMRALAQLGEPQFLAFVIEEEDAAPYRLFFNGNRIAPWMRKATSAVAK
jgi:ParB-like nuclease domain